MFREFEIAIGFCDDKQFPLVKVNGLGFGKNSIGIWNKQEMWIDELYAEIGSVIDNFEEGDVVGLGLINSTSSNTSKISLFATWNGKILGKK